MENVSYQKYSIIRNDRHEKNNHGSVLIWLTGLSGSGKSTIADIVEKKLFEKQCQVYALDGDNIRNGLNAKLGFTKEDRDENLRRIGEVAKLFIDAGTITIAAFISPLIENRRQVKEIVGGENFIEIHLSTPLEECEKRDVKGLYSKARKGEIANFTGISAPYEAPEKPDLSFDTTELSADFCADKIIELLIEKKIIG